MKATDLEKAGKILRWARVQYERAATIATAQTFHRVTNECEMEYPTDVVDAVKAILVKHHSEKLAGLKAELADLGIEITDADLLPPPKATAALSAHVNLYGGAQLSS